MGFFAFFDRDVRRNYIYEPNPSCDKILKANIEKLYSHGSDFHLHKECVVAHAVDATKFVDKISYAFQV